MSTTGTVRDLVPERCRYQLSAGFRMEKCTLPHRRPTPLGASFLLMCGGLHPFLIYSIEDRL